MFIKKVINFNKYQLKEVLGSYDYFYWGQFVSLKSLKKCLLKAIDEKHIDETTIELLERECKVLLSLDHENIMKPKKIINSKYIHALVFDYDEYVLLKDIFLRKSFDINNSLNIALQVCETLKYIHERGIIYRNLSAANIFLNPHNDRVKLLNFDKATYLAQVSTQNKNLDLIEGDPYYIAPEQCARMQRQYDHRADIYSFGIFLYQLFTHLLPFSGGDIAEIIYQHITKIPLAPNEINPAIPGPIANLIMKCLQKQPDHRYQSIQGVYKDLLILSNSIMNNKRVDDFQIARYDTITKLTISQKIYGRNSEFSQVYDACENFLKSRPLFILISGQSGVGKSRLIREVLKSETANNGIFLYGKFDLMQRIQPYSAWKQITHDFVEKILCMNEKDFETMRSHLKKMIHPNEKIMTEFIPDLEKVIGKDQGIENIDLDFARNRFFNSFYNFIKAMILKWKTIILVFEDIQWIDQDSMNLIQVLACDYQLENTIFICSYRDNEVDDTHRFMLSLKQIEKSQIPIEDICLKKLDKKYVEEFIADTLFTSVEDVRELSKYISEKTDGNPFFINQFLQTIYQRNLLYYSAVHNKWMWKIEDIKNQVITSNVVDLLILNLKSFDVSTQSYLQYAACIGNVFDLKTIAVITQKRVYEVHAGILPALNQGYIFSLDEDNITGELITPQSLYKFSHDRLQQAAYALLEEKIKAKVHLKIAQLLVQRYSKFKIQQSLFQIVNNFNIASGLLNSKKAQLQLAHLNYFAGRKALNAIAYKPALEYFIAAKKLYGSISWKIRYTRTFSLFYGATNAAYLSADYELQNSLFQETLHNTKSSEDKIKIYALQTSVLNSISKAKESFELAIESLKFSNIYLPSKISKIGMLIGLLKLTTLLKWKGLNNLPNLKMSEDKTFIAAVDLMVHGMSSFYANVDPLLMTYIGFKILTTIIKRGNTPASSVLYMCFVVVFVLLKNKKMAQAMVDISDAIYKKHPNEYYRSYTFHVNAVYNMPLTKRIEESYSSFIKGFNHSLDRGFYEASAVCAYWYAIYMRINSERLDFQKDEILKYNKKLKQIKQYFITHVLDMMLELIDFLKFYREKNDKLNGNYFNADEQLLSIMQHSDKTIVEHYFYYNFLLNFYFGHYEKSYESAIKANMLNKPRDPASLDSFYAYSRLILCMLKLFPGSLNQPNLMKKIKAFIKEIKAQSKIAPINVSHLYYMSMMQLHHTLSSPKKSREFLDLALSHCEKYQFLFDKALIHELAGQNFLDKNMLPESLMHLISAKKNYYLVNAQAKVDQIERKYNFLFENLYKTLENGNGLFQNVKSKSGKNIITSADDDLFNLKKLDQNKIFNLAAKISQLVSMHEEGLIIEILKLFSKFFRPDRSVLCLISDEQLYYEGEYKTRFGTENILCHEDYQHVSKLPSSLIKNALTNLKPLVLSLDTSINYSGYDEYFDTFEKISVITMPIIYQGRLCGIIYMEKYEANYFNFEDIQILNLLSAQLMITLENSRLYQAFDRFVPKKLLDLLNKQSPLEVELNDNRQLDLSIMYIDIRGFTAITEKYSVSKVFLLLNQFLEYTTPTILKWNGFIDKYIGDAIMAVFPSDVEDAIACGIEIRQHLADFNHKFIKHKKAFWDIGIALHTGQTILSMLGNQQRLDGVIVSAVVNVAERLEKLNKYYGTSMLLTQDVFEKITHEDKFHLRKIDEVSLDDKGKKQEIWEVIDAQLDETIRDHYLATLDEFKQGFENFRNNDYTKAASKFKQVLIKNPHDKAAQLLMERAADALKTGLMH